MTSVRILHASDLHISSVSNITSPFDHFTPGTVFDAVVEKMLVSTYDPAVLLRLVDFIHKQVAKRGLDAVLLTGDIATTGDIDDLNKALDFIQAAPDPRLLSLTSEKEPTLGNLRIPIWLLPGNHDRYKVGPRYKMSGLIYAPGGKDFDVVFEDYWQGPVMSFSSSDYGVEYYAPIIRDRLAVVVVGVDFNLLATDNCDRPYGWLAQGKVYDKILDKLEAETFDRVRNCHAQGLTHVCVIWAMHFPPHYPRISPFLKLLDSEFLTLRANACGVKAILAGHTHDPVRYRRPEMKFDVFCAGTASQAFVHGGNHCRVLDITSDNAGNISIVSEDYLYRGFSNGVITNRSGFYPV